MIRKWALVLLVAAVGCHAFVGGTDGPLGVGATPPKLAAEGWLNGNSQELSQFAGRVTVVDVWAYW